jgi:transcriptional regulator with XRE-family HTH domain
MLGTNINKYRQLRGLSLSELSNRCNLSVGYISDIEKGVKTNPSIETLYKIAEALDVKLIDLVSEEDFSDTYGSENITVAAHHDGEDWTEEELAEIERFKEFVRMKREQRSGDKNDR